MRGCPKCKELTEDLETLIIKYRDAVDDNKQLAATHAGKPDAETMERTTKAAMLDARKALEDHMKSAHSHIAAN